MGQVTGMEGTLRSPLHCYPNTPDPSPAGRLPAEAPEDDGDDDDDDVGDNATDEDEGVDGVGATDGDEREVEGEADAGTGADEDEDKSSKLTKPLKPPLVALVEMRLEQLPAFPAREQCQWPC